MFVKYALIMVNSFLAYKNLRIFVELYLSHMFMSEKFRTRNIIELSVLISFAICGLVLSKLLLLFYA